MGGLEQLLTAAREKAAAEVTVRETQLVLQHMADELAEAREVRSQLERDIGKATSVFGRLRGRGVDADALTQRIAQVDASIAELERRRKRELERVKTARAAAHGADLARAQVAAELRRLTDRLSPDDPVRVELDELNHRRRDLVEQRDAATGLASVAGELLPSIEAASAATVDGSEQIYLPVQFLSAKYEQLGEVIEFNPYRMRLGIREQIGFAGSLLDAATDHPALVDLARLSGSDVRADGDAWLGEVHMALTGLLESGMSVAERVREQLVDLDRRRIDLLAD